MASSNSNIVLKIFIAITVIEVINLLSGRWLNQFALYPRDLGSLAGIFVSPFVHGNIWHYASNIWPLCLFSFLTLQYGRATFYKITAVIITASGLLVWLLARDALHLGASSLVYGYFGFLLLAGFINKKLKLIAISLLVSFFYGGMIFGVMPTAGFVSWESHLGGFAVGLFAAKTWAKNATS